MKPKIKFLFTDLQYIKHNYGVQGIAFPLMDKLDEYFDAEYTFALFSKKNFTKDLKFAENFSFNIFQRSRLKLSHLVKRKELNKHKEFIKILKQNDVVMDITGIEFIGNQQFIERWKNLINTIYTQILAKKHHKIYLKYTKSFGPFPHKIYSLIVRKYLNKLPFLYVRGEDNLKTLRKFDLSIPVYSFPDISLTLESEKKDWAINYLKEMQVDISKPIIGISPSAVVNGISGKSENSSCGQNHLILCKKIIDFFQSESKQILLIPHSIEDGKSIKSCDLALCRKIFSELQNRDKIFLMDDQELDYRQVRTIISLLDFYITARYHALSSALSVAIPVVSLSWHIKYRDIMSLFMDNFLAIDSRETSVELAYEQIIKYYENRDWFNQEDILSRKDKIIKKIDKSIKLIADEIKGKK